MMTTELTSLQSFLLIDPEYLHQRTEEDLRAAAWSSRTVNYIAAAKICKRLHELTGELWRLPTEAEWEYACRAGSTTDYAWGDGIEALRRSAFVNPTGQKLIHRPWIKQYEPNAWGLYDMHGSLPELTATPYWPTDFYPDLKRPRQRSRTYTRFISRGGSYLDPPECCRSATRRELPGINTGIRLVLDRTGQPPTK